MSSRSQSRCQLSLVHDLISHESTRYGYDSSRPGFRQCTLRLADSHRTNLQEWLQGQQPRPQSAAEQARARGCHLEAAAGEGGDAGSARKGLCRLKKSHGPFKPDHNLQIHQVLERERYSLKEVLAAARKAVDDLKAISQSSKRQFRDPPFVLQAENVELKAQLAAAKIGRGDATRELSQMQRQQMEAVQVSPAT